MAQQLARPPARDLGLLAIAVAFISTSGPIIAVTAAPALAIAFWRCFFGSAATAPWVIVRKRAEFASLTRREWRLAITAGVFLGAHFAAWIPSLRFTSVASSTALVATQPVWAALIARAIGVRITRSVWIGIAIALAGALVLTGVDFSLDPSALIGDGLALLGAILAAAYVSTGERVRQSVSTATMTLIVYSTSAIALLALCLLMGEELGGYDAQAWIYIIALTIGAQLLGHTLINRVLSSTSATITSLAILFEMPGATLIAAIWLGQIPPLAIIPAVILIFMGLVIVIRQTTGPQDAPTEISPI